MLRSLRDAIPSRWPAKVDELRSLAATTPTSTLVEFLDESGLDLDDVYDGSQGWSDLREAAGVPTRPAGPHEKPLRRAIGPAAARRRRRANRHLPATSRSRQRRPTFRVDAGARAAPAPHARRQRWPTRR